MVRNRNSCLDLLIEKCCRIIDTIVAIIFAFSACLQCFDAVGWAAGRASGL